MDRRCWSAMLSKYRSSCRPHPEASGLRLRLRPRGPGKEEPELSLDRFETCILSPRRGPLLQFSHDGPSAQRQDRDVREKKIKEARLRAPGNEPPDERICEPGYCRLISTCAVLRSSESRAMRISSMHISRTSSFILLKSEG